MTARSHDEPGHDAPAGVSSPAPPAGRALFVVLLVLSVAEIATLGLLLVNLALLHVRPIAQAIGPVHGAVYLAVVAIAVFAPGLRRRDRALGFVPVVGGALAVWRLRHRPASAPVVASTPDDDDALASRPTPTPDPSNGVTS